MWRKLKTDGNQEEDFELECGESYLMEWGTYKGGTTSDIVVGWMWDTFTIALSEDCTVVLSSAL